MKRITEIHATLTRAVDKQNTQTEPGADPRTFLGGGRVRN